VIDAADPADLRVVAQAPRRGPWILDVKAAGDLAFSSDAGYVNIYDVRDPKKPKVLKHLRCGAKYMSVDAERKVLYYRTGDMKLLHQLDISDPANPRELTIWPRKYKEERTYWVVPHEKVAYVWVSVPLEPEEEKKKEKPPELPSGDVEEEAAPDFSIDAIGERKRADDKKLKKLAKERSAASSKEGFYQVTRIYDISGGWNEPKLVREMKAGQVIEMAIEQGGRWHGIGRRPDGGIAVYDLSDASDPKLMATHSMIGGAWKIKDNFLYVASGRPDGKQGGLSIFEFDDFRQPPRLIGRLNTFDRRYMETRSRWHSLLVRGETVFVLDYFFGLVAIDVSNKAQPEIVGGLHTAGEAFCLDVSDSRIFIGENMGGLTIMDNRVPEKARIVGNFGIGGGWGVFARGDIAFCANLAGLMIVDSKDPKDPIELSYAGDIYNALAVKVVGDYAYCMGNGGYGDIFDVSNLRRPVRLGRFRTKRSFRLDVRGDHLYVADHHEGLVIFDISDRKHPKRVSVFRNGGGASDVEVKGRYAFVSAAPGLQIIDVSDPYRPALYASSKAGRGGAVIGDFIYSTSYFGGNKLSVTDISDLKRPRFLEGFNPGSYSYATQCKVHGKYLYLASLPYLSICKAPMSSEAPKGVVAVKCATMPVKDGESRTATRILEASLKIEHPIVPGFSSLARASLRNRGKEMVRLTGVKVASSDNRVRIQPLSKQSETQLPSGQTVQTEFRISLSAQTRTDERVPLLAEWVCQIADEQEIVRRKSFIRAEGLLTVAERFHQLDVTNLEPASISCAVTNNTDRTQELSAFFELPEGWLAPAGATRKLELKARETTELSFSCKLPDKKASLGELQARLRIQAGTKTLYEKSMDAVAARRMRWRIMGPFSYDVTSRKRPIPEQEILFNKTYRSGKLTWRSYQCDEGAPVDLCRPAPGISSGSVLFFYGATYVRSDRARNVKFSVTGDPAILSGPKEIKGWLNGRQVIGEEIVLPPDTAGQITDLEADETQDDEDLLLKETESKAPKPNELEKGWNLLLIRVCWLNNWHFKGHWTQSKPKWPFRILIKDDEGKPVRNVSFDSEKWGR
jgi:hypothetical protein